MKRCPQCMSTECGAYVCRFSGLTHKQFYDQKAADLYAAQAIERAKAEPRWLKELREGAYDGMPGCEWK